MPANTSKKSPTKKWRSGHLITLGALAILILVWGALMTKSQPPRETNLSRGTSPTRSEPAPPVNARILQRAEPPSAKATVVTPASEREEETAAVASPSSEISAPQDPQQRARLAKMQEIATTQARVAKLRLRLQKSLAAFKEGQQKRSHSADEIKAFEAELRELSRELQKANQEALRFQEGAAGN